MRVIERITLKEAVLVGDTPVGAGHGRDIRDGGARYAKVLYGIREAVQDEQYPQNVGFLSFRLTGYIFQYRFFRPRRQTLIKLQAANILCIDQRRDTDPIQVCGYCGEAGLHSHTVVETDYAALERRLAKTVQFARAYGWEGPAEHRHEDGGRLQFPLNDPAVPYHRHAPSGAVYHPRRVAAHHHAPSGRVCPPL